MSLPEIETYYITMKLQAEYPTQCVPSWLSILLITWVAVISAKNNKRQRRKRQSVTAKREKSQTPKVSTAIPTLPNLT